MYGFVDEAYKTFEATGAIGENLLVKILSTGKIDVCGLNEEPIGVACRPALAAGDRIPVKLLSGDGTFKGKAEGPITAAAVIYGRAGGLIDDNATGALRLGIALEAAGAASDHIEYVYSRG